MDNNDKVKIFIGSDSFGKYDRTAVDMLHGSSDVKIVDNIIDANGVIAGTEPYNEQTLGMAENLMVISRMGVGYDNVDVDYCIDNDITVTYTPDAPSGSVAELTISHIMNMIRGIYFHNDKMRNGIWKKRMGRLISEINIGVIGVGRIGQKVINRLKPFEPKTILAYDTNYEKLLNFQNDSCQNFTICSNLNYLLYNSDVVTVHIPGNLDNKYFISDDFLNNMKINSYLVNTSRGSIINEKSLIDHISNLAGVALDVFNNEPYTGDLCHYDNVFMTPHIGSLTLTARIKMETQAVSDCVTSVKGGIPFNVIPEISKIQEVNL